MKVLLLGSGGREHALGWAIREARPQAKLCFLPGNGGTHQLGENLAGDASDPAQVVERARDFGPDLTVIGPEAPLVAGVSDQLRAGGFAVFGPSAAAAEIEGSKVFAKTLMRNAGVPTAAFEVYDDPVKARAAATSGLYPKVIKADGLAAGKGVFIARTRAEADAAVTALMEDDAFGQAGRQILIEAFLEGEEVSAFAIARDDTFTLLPLSQDHKRIGEGDTGPNTGGMGAYAPFPGTTPELMKTIENDVIEPVLRAMRDAGRPFRGLLYAGLMMVHGRPQVLEFNCRFGDPESQALMPLLGDGFVEALESASMGSGPVPEVALRTGADGHPLCAAGVVLASNGYPGSYRTGFDIEGLETAAGLPETWVFHAGTRVDRNRVVTSGGRVLAVVGRGANLRAALGRAYEGASSIEFEGMYYRKDIGHRGLAERRSNG